MKHYKTKISPKSDFLSDPPRSGRHQDVVLNPEFKAAVQVAYAEYSVNLTFGDANSQIATVGLKLEGARAVLNELMNLGVPNNVGTMTDNDNLTPT